MGKIYIFTPIFLSHNMIIHYFYLLILTSQIMICLGFLQSTLILLFYVDILFTISLGRVIEVFDVIALD